MNTLEAADRVMRILYWTIGSVGWGIFAFLCWKIATGRLPPVLPCAR